VEFMINHLSTKIVEFIPNAPPGAIVEVGVYKAVTLIRLANVDPNRQVFGYDTFEGFPYADTIHTKHGGYLCTLEKAQQACDDQGLHNNITLIKGIYPDSDKICPRVAVAHLDTDLYKSTIESLDHLASLMNLGGRIYVHDFENSTCPGVTKAVKEWSKANKKSYEVLEHFHVLIQF
jgi:O-methyltransferase